MPFGRGELAEPTNKTGMGMRFKKCTFARPMAGLRA